MTTLEIRNRSIFDTRFDTKKIFVTVSYRFSPRTYVDKDGLSLIYLDIHDSKNRERLSTEIKIDKKHWDSKKQRLRKVSDNVLQLKHENYNLILDNIDGKITEIKTRYILQKRILDAKTLVEEFQSNTPEFDFISFYRHQMNSRVMAKQTRKNYNAVLNKLVDFRPEVPFHKIDEMFFKKYRDKYSYNAKITYHSDLKCIKKILRIAVKKGIQIGMDLDDLKVDVTSKRKIYLLPEEMKKLLQYFFSDFILPEHRISLGYFLKACYSGMRISDIKELNREVILDHSFRFTHVKSENFQNMKLNEDARKLLLHEPELFKGKIVEQVINRHLKVICKSCRIHKKVSMHVARHTFATTFYRNTKDIVQLQQLLGHTKISSTMVYVHLVESENLSSLDSIKY